MKQDEKMLARLQENARADYADILKTADFSPEKMEDTALKITVCKAFLESVEDFEPEFSGETAVFLLYQKPITMLYEGFQRHDCDMTDLLGETLSDLTMELKHQLNDLPELQTPAQEDTDDLER